MRHYTSGSASYLSKMVVIVAFVCALSALLDAQPARTPAKAPDAVDRFVAGEMSSKHIPGISIAVSRRGKLIKAEGYGKADLEHDIAVTPETVFKIGSVSKQFLATGIMLLAQEGKLSIDDPVSKYVEGTPESWRGITLRHLLTHTSGILREGPAFDPFKVQSDSAVIMSAFARPLEFPIGSKYQYCNVCYFTLADIIARVSGMPWEMYFAEKVFKPTGMTSTRATTTTALVTRRARGYVWRNHGYENAQEFIAVRPSGAFISTVMDLARWDTALSEDRLLSKASREAMWAPAKLNSGEALEYGFGWELSPFDGHKQVHHGGSLPGFRAEMALYPDDGLTVIVLTNADGARPDQIARGIAKIYFSSAK